MRMCATLAQSHARLRHITCEPIRTRHTVAPYWLTLVRRARHFSAQAPCASARHHATYTRTQNHQGHV
ncbi:hypothetical protein Hanom_Chr11g00998651 [Helianthus anomalus]